MATISGDIVSSSLPSHDLDLLRRGDLAERARLLQTCEKYGFFYLDLRSDSALLDKWQLLLDAMAEYFAQPPEVKMQDDRASDNTGYALSHADACSGTRHNHLPGTSRRAPQRVTT
jgi:isopenicillin N synthase-like dioxygenase